MKIIIVGGVAGGASCAARLRRLDEKAEILMKERGPYGTRILVQTGFDAFNISGGMLSRSHSTFFDNLGDS